MCAKMRDAGASEEEVKQKVLATLFRKTTVLSPEHLVGRGIPVTRAYQAPGEYIITFPRSYHLGFSHGINLGEAVNFAMKEWYEFGTDAAMRMTFLRKSPVRCPMLSYARLLPASPVGTVCLRTSGHVCAAVPCRRGTSMSPRQRLVPYAAVARCTCAPCGGRLGR
jgi:JmjC domain, hydroxylase